MHTLQSVLRLMPAHIAGQITETGIFPEEIRLRFGQAVVLRAAGKEALCTGDPVRMEDIIHLVRNASNGSYHSCAEQLAQGYLPLPGGCRMGVSGEGTNGRIRNAAQISSVCIRVAGEVMGCADEVLPQLLQPDFQNTIIISPPGGGKTTLLRELIRKLGTLGYYTAVADERGEISGMVQGRRNFDLGPRCDVTTGLPKKTAALMLLRAMAPDILAMDEITAIADSETILEAVGCGVGLLTTMHGRDISALRKPGFREIYDTKAFEKAIVISIEQGRRRYQVVNLYD